MRWSAWLFMTISWPCAAASWRSQSLLEGRLQQVSLRSDTDTEKAHRETIQSGVRAAEVFFSESEAAEQRVRLTADAAMTLDTHRWLQNLSAEALQTWNTARTHLTLGLNLTEKRGEDLVGLPLEQSFQQNPEPFRSIGSFLSYQYALDATQSLVASVAFGRNTQSPSALNTEEAQAAWIYRPEQHWTVSLQLRRGQQQGLAIPDESFTEISHSEFWAFAPFWSLDGNIGWTQQIVQDQSQQALLFSGALNFYADPSANSAENLNKRFRPLYDSLDTASEAGLQHSSLARIGWSRSFDQRRAGDPFFLADRYVLRLAQAVFKDQGLAIEGSLLEAASTLPTRGTPRHANVLLAQYHWTFTDTLVPAAPRGALGLELLHETSTAEAAKLRRRSAAVSLSMIF